MSMSTHVYGFKPPDEKWRQMKSVYDICITADVAIPIEVEKFFEYEAPDLTGVKVDIEKTAAVLSYEGDMEQGYTIVLALLPKDVTHVRVVNSW